MAYGNVVGYQPIEGTPDAYRFQMADGSSMPVMGAAAQDLKARLDAADAATRSGMLASNDAVAAPMTSATDGTPVAGQAPPPPPGPVASVAPAQVAAPPSEANMSPNPGPQEAPAAAAPQAPPAPGPVSPVAGGTVFPVGGVNVGIVKGQDGRLYKYRAPSAGSPGGPVQKTETQSGGFTPSEEYVQQQTEAYQKRQAAAEVGMQAAQEQAAGQRAFLDEQARQQAADYQESVRKQADIDKGVADLQGKYAQAQKDFASAPPPGDRRTGAQRVIGALAMGLGALGAGLAKTPNFAMQIINKSIDDDIRSQEAAIAIKKDKVNNTLGDLTRQMGSAELARSAVRGIRLQQAKTQYDKIAATTADAQVRASALDMAGRLEAEHNNVLEDYRLKSVGQVTKQFVIAPKVAPSAGGWDPLSTNASLNVTEKGADLDAKNAGTAKTLASVGQPKGGAGGARQASELSGLNAALAGLDQYEALHAKYGSPGVLNSGVGGSEASKSLGAAAEALGPIVGRGLEGNAPNDSTMKDIKGNLLSASGDKIKASIGQYRQQLQNRRRAIIEAGPGAPAAEEPAPREE